MHEPALTLDDFDYALPPELDRAGARGRCAARAACCTSTASGSPTSRFADLRRPLPRGRPRRVERHARHARARRGTQAPGGRVELLVERIVGPRRGVGAAQGEPRCRSVGRHDPARRRRARDGARARRRLLPAARRRPTLRSTPGSSATATCRCRRTSRGPRAPRTRSATRPSTRASPAPSPRRRPGCTSTTPLLDALAARGVALAHVTLHVGAGHVPAGARRRPRAHRMHSERYAIPQATVDAIARARAARRPRAGGRHDRRCARSKPPRADGPLRAGERRDRPVHPPGLPVPRRRPAAHELPPAALDAADAGRARSPGSRRSAAPTRTRSRRATASSATATRCCWKKPL